MATYAEQSKAFMEKARGARRSAKILYDTNYLVGATDRAYFVIFHSARSLLLTKGIEVDTDDGSRFLNMIDACKEYRKQYDQVGDFMISTIIGAGEFRRAALYDNWEMVKSEVLNLINQAEEFLDVMEKEVVIARPTKQGET